MNRQNKNVDNPKITSISICAGVGMFDQAVKIIFPEILPLAYVEWESYAAACLLARMEEKSMEPAPIWCGDLSEFDAKTFRGLVDILLAGLPCQPYSPAGKKGGNEDERSWGKGGAGPIQGFLEIVEQMLPALVILENVPAWIRHRKQFFRPVGDELSRMGYEIVEPVFVAASDVAASHERERVFILAYLPGARSRGLATRLGSSWQRAIDSYRTGGGLADAARDYGLGAEWSLPDGRPKGGPHVGNGSSHLADPADDARGQQSGEQQSQRREESRGSGDDLADPVRERGQQKPGSAFADESKNAGRTAQDNHEPSSNRAALDNATRSRRKGRAGSGPKAKQRGGKRLPEPGCERLGDAKGDERRNGCDETGTERNGAGAPAASGNLAESKGRGRGELRQSPGRDGQLDGSIAKLADASGAGHEGRELGRTFERRGPGAQRSIAELCQNPLFAPGPSDPRWKEIIAGFPELSPAVKPGFRVLADGLALVLDKGRADQLRCTGNGVVALQAAIAIVELLRRAKLI